MRIKSGFQDGGFQQRILLIEPGDVGKEFALYVEITGDIEHSELGIDLEIIGPSSLPLPDPIGPERAQGPQPQTPAAESGCVKCGKTKQDELVYPYGDGEGYWVHPAWCRPGQGCNK